MFCAAFLNKKQICEILTSKLTPSLVYHGLIRALLSLALSVYNITFYALTQRIHIALVNLLMKLKKTDIRRGEWTGRNDLVMETLAATTSRHPSHNAEKIRNIFCKYFYGRGQVSWQWKHVN